MTAVLLFLVMTALTPSQAQASPRETCTDLIRMEFDGDRELAGACAGIRTDNAYACLKRCFSVSQGLSTEAIDMCARVNSQESLRCALQAMPTEEESPGNVFILEDLAPCLDEPLSRPLWQWPTF